MQATDNREETMAAKMIGIVAGIIVVGLFAWKFRETSLCRP